MIYLRFITDLLSVESFLIRFGTKSWASHVEFIKVQGSKAIETLGSRYPDGIQTRPPDYCKPSYEQWYYAPGIDEAYERLKIKIGCRYDWKDILGITLDMDWHTNGRFICSEAVAWAFEHIREPLLNPHIAVRKITPRDLLLSPKLVYVTRIA
jgi:hypothetical protein